MFKIIVITITALYDVGVIPYRNDGVGFKIVKWDGVKSVLNIQVRTVDEDFKEICD